MMFAGVGASRTFSESLFEVLSLRTLKKNMPKQWAVTFGLMALIFASALAVVYVQAENRRLFSELAAIQQHRDNLHVEWGQLLLEGSTWATQSRVQYIARQELHMSMPKVNKITLIRM